MSLTCLETWQKMTELSQTKSIRNFSCDIDLSNYLVETDLFTQDVLQAYSMWNLEKNMPPELQKYFNNTRGGAQGDYRQGMSSKIQNVITCLNAFPASKRAVITICNKPNADHKSDDDAKCMRELHLYLGDNNTLNATVLFRAQAATIFPKNIHFIGSLMSEVAAKLNSKPHLGNLHYLTTILVSNRE